MSVRGNTSTTTKGRNLMRKELRPPFRVTRDDGKVVLCFPLTQGQFMYADLEDEQLLRQYNWYAHKNDHIGWQVATNVYQGNRRAKTLLAHQLIFGSDCDHIDRDELNNCRDNLRKANLTQQALNQKVYRSNTSGYKGVSFNKRAKKWVAWATKNRKQYFLGYFSSPEEAFAVRQEANVRLHGEWGLEGEHVAS